MVLEINRVSPWNYKYSPILIDKTTYFQYLNESECNDSYLLHDETVLNIVICLYSEAGIVFGYASFRELFKYACPGHKRLLRQSGARRSSVVRAFAHGAMGRWIDPSWWTY